jgi:NAD(P)-dependent dehydrogenase (short-subunit alcohol dehydrogenase family)
MNKSLKVVVVTGASQDIGDPTTAQRVISEGALAALTKGGLDAATKSLAIEYAKKGIHHWRDPARRRRAKCRPLRCTFQRFSLTMPNGVPCPKSTG